MWKKKLWNCIWSWYVVINEKFFNSFCLCSINYSWLGIGNNLLFSKLIWGQHPEMLSNRWYSQNHHQNLYDNVEITNLEKSWNNFISTFGFDSRIVAVSDKVYSFVQALFLLYKLLCGKRPKQSSMSCTFSCSYHIKSLCQKECLVLTTFPHDVCIVRIDNSQRFVAMFWCNVFAVLQWFDVLCEFFNMNTCKNFSKCCDERCWPPISF